jgi:hypothetical protein
MDASRIAATGAIFAARRAGISAAAAVTSTPTANEAMIVRGSTSVGPGGNSAPIALNSALSPSATPMPASSPTADAISPTTTDSPSTDRVIWRRLAPSARISASSLVRCAIRIENVLKMMNAPTNSATPANTSRNVLKKLSPFLMSLACSSANAWPVMASAPLGSAAAIRSRSVCWLTPSFAAACTSVNAPGMSSTFCAVAVSNMT